MQPLSKEALYKMKRDLESSLLQDFSKAAGNPSAPADEEALSSAHAFLISLAENVKSVREGSSGTVSNKIWGP